MPDCDRAMGGLCDGDGRLYALTLPAGQVADVIGGRALLARVPATRHLVADKAYDAEDIRAFLAAQGTGAVIPPKSDRGADACLRPVAYRARNVMKRAFCRLKDWRGVATR